MCTAKGFTPTGPFPLKKIFLGQEIFLAENFPVFIFLISTCEKKREIQTDKMSAINRRLLLLLLLRNRLAKRTRKQLKYKKDITKCSLHREVIPPGERLCLTLRYLVTGDAQISMASSYRISPMTVGQIIVKPVKLFGTDYSIMVACDVLQMKVSGRRLQKSTNSCGTSQTV